MTPELRPSYQGESRKRVRSGRSAARREGEARALLHRAGVEVGARRGRGGVRDRVAVDERDLLADVRADRRGRELARGQVDDERRAAPRRRARAGAGAASPPPQAATSGRPARARRASAAGSWHGLMAGDDSGARRIPTAYSPQGEAPSCVPVSRCRRTSPSSPRSWTGLRRRPCASPRPGRRSRGPSRELVEALRHHHTRDGRPLQPAGLAVPARGGGARRSRPTSSSRSSSSRSCTTSASSRCPPRSSTSRGR